MHVLSTASYLPGQPVTNQMLAEVFGEKVVPIGKFFGVNSRHYAVDFRSGEHSGEYNSDILAKAAERALQKAECEPAEIDLVIAATATADYVLPQTSLLLQQKLDIMKAMALDIRGGCTSSLQGVLLAKSLIESGNATKALIVGGECFSTVIYHYLLKMKDNWEISDIMNALIYGDGAGAVVISKEDPKALGFSIKHLVSRSEDAQKPYGLLINYGGSKNVDSIEKPSFDEIAKIFPRNLESVLPSVCRHALDDITQAGYPVSSLANLVWPQANPRLMEGMSRHFPKDAPIYYAGESIGNMPSGALLVALDLLLQKKSFKPKDLVGIVGAESALWCWASLILEKS